LTNFDDTTVGEGEIFDENGGLFREFIVQLEIVTDITEFLLYLTYSFEICCSVERISSSKEKFNQLTSDIPSSNI